MLPKLLVAGTSALALVVTTAACREPTEIVLHVTTDIPCSQLGSVSIFLAHPGDDPTNLNAMATTNTCAGAGDVGTLVIFPETSDDETIVVLAVTTNDNRDSSQCLSAFTNSCVVAKRQVAYVAHTSLDVPIALQTSCVGVQCLASSTCVNGLCVSAVTP